MSGRVLFVGCGPGAADLLTVRAVRALQSADIVIWNSTLLDRQTLSDHTRDDAEIVQWPPATRDDIEAAYDRALAEGLRVVRLKGGDPTLFGVLEPELSAVRERGVACEIVPGVSALSAGFAALGREMATAAAGLLLVDAAGLVDGEPETTGIVAYGANRDPRALQRALLARAAGARPAGRDAVHRRDRCRTKRRGADLVRAGRSRRDDRGHGDGRADARVCRQFVAYASRRRKIWTFVRPATSRIGTRCTGHVAVCSRLIVYVARFRVIPERSVPCP